MFRHFSLLMDYHKSYAISMSALRIIIDRITNFDSELKQAQSTGTAPDWVSYMYMHMYMYMY